MTVHDGPGKKRLVPKSKQSTGARDWEKKTDPGFHRSWKLWYLKNFDERRFAIFTPYFSKPIYQTLLHDLRTLLYSYLDRKMERPEDEDGNRPEIDLFPEMEEIYSKVLGCFDVAIQALAPAPKAPLRTQPDRQVRLAKRRRDEDSNPPSLPHKRARVDSPRIIPLNNAMQHSASSVPFNVRGSSRLNYLAWQGYIPPGSKRKCSSHQSRADKINSR